MMNPEELLKQVDKLQDVLKNQNNPNGIVSLVGKKVIVQNRKGLYWYGTLAKKCKEEILLSEARKLVSFVPAEGIFPEDCASSGVTDTSTASLALDQYWTVASEIYLCSATAIESLDELKSPSKD